MKLFSSGILSLIAIIATAPFAGATVLYFQGGPQLTLDAVEIKGPTSGNFDDPKNWSTVPQNTNQTGGISAVPGPGDIAVIQADINNSTVFYQSPNFAFFNLNATVPVTINETTSNTVAGFVVSNYSFFGAGSGIVNFNSASGTFTINGTGAAGGDFIVDGGVTLNYTGGPFVVHSGTIVIGDNGPDVAGGPYNIVGGNGTFNIKFGSFTYDASGTTTSMIVGNGTITPNVFASGGTGTVTQGQAGIGLSSTAVLGSSLVIGENQGTGTWNVTNGSRLSTGTLASSYVIALGVNGAGNNLVTTAGTINVNTGSTFNVGSVGTAKPVDMEVGVLAGGQGSIIEADKTTTVNFAGQSTTVELGFFGGFGSYTLQGGTLNIGVNATDAVSFSIGADATSTGTLIQTGGTMVVGNLAGTNSTSFVVGGAGGTGTYTITGGTATFNNVLSLNAGGTINLDGGTINVSADDFIGTGVLNFGGGTLNLINGTTFTDNFSGGVLTTGTTSTIEADTGAFTTVTINQSLSGGGAIIFKGTTGTTFSFNGTVGGTGVIGGTLNITSANITNAGFLSINSNDAAPGGPAPGIVNLDMGGSDLAFGGLLSGNGTFNVNFGAPGETLFLTDTANATSGLTIVLAANTGLTPSLTPGTFQVLSGTYGDIDEVGTGNNVTIGTNAGSGTVTIGNGNYTGLTTVFKNYTLNATSLEGDATVGSVALPGGTLMVTGAAGIGGNVTNNGGIVGVITGGIGGSLTNSGQTFVGGATGVTGDVDNALNGTLFTPIVGGNVTNAGVITFSNPTPLVTNTVGGNLTNDVGGIIINATPLPTTVNTPSFTIGGNLTSPGALTVRLGGTVADQYAAGGTANLDNGVIDVVVLKGGKIGITDYNIVTAPGGVTDAGLTPSQDMALFRYVLINNGTFETLQVTQLPSASYAMTPNQLAVANSLDGSNSPLFTYFAAIPLAFGSTLIPAALEQLSPESLQYSRNIAFENSNMLAIRMNNIDADLRAGYGGLDTNAISVTSVGFNNNLSRGLGSFFASNDAFHQSAPNGVNYYPGGESGPETTTSPAETPASYDPSSQVMSDSPNPYLANQYPSGPEAPNMNEFVGGDVVLADLNQNHGNDINAPTDKASYAAGDAVAGVAFRINPHFTAGMLFDYNHTDAKTDNSGSHVRVDSYSPGLFATFADHGFYANGLAVFGYNAYSNSRKINITDQTANSSPAGQQYVGDLDAGYDFHPDKSWVVGPTLGATYTHLDVDSFSETGAPNADLDVNSQSVDSLRSRLGVHAIFQTNTGDVLLQPNLALMWQHEYMADSSGITSSFRDFAANPFTIQTAAPTRDSALISLGLNATLSNSMALYFNYLADVGGTNYWAQSVVGGLKARF